MWKHDFATQTSNVSCTSTLYVFYIYQVYPNRLGHVEVGHFLAMLKKKQKRKLYILFYLNICC